MMRMTIMFCLQTQKITVMLAISESQSTKIIHRVLLKARFHVSSNSVINQHITLVAVLSSHCLFLFHHSQTSIVCYMIRNLLNQYETDKESSEWKTMLWMALISTKNILSSLVSLTFTITWSSQFKISHLTSLELIELVRTSQLDDLLLSDLIYTLFFSQFKQHRCKLRLNWKNMLQNSSWWLIKMIQNRERKQQSAELSDNQILMIRTEHNLFIHENLRYLLDLMQLHSSDLLFIKVLYRVLCLQSFMMYLWQQCFRTAHRSWQIHIHFSF